LDTIVEEEYSNTTTTHDAAGFQYQVPASSSSSTSSASASSATGGFPARAYRFAAPATSVQQQTRCWAMESYTGTGTRRVVDDNTFAKLSTSTASLQPVYRLRGQNQPRLATSYVMLYASRHVLFPWPSILYACMFPACWTWM
jgi:hypothetical protein